MRCSRKFPVLLVCLALVVGASAAKKDDPDKDAASKDDAKKEAAKKKDKGGDKKSKATPAPTTPAPGADGDAKPRPKLSLPLPTGHSSFGVKFPYNDGSGKKTMSFDIGEATRLDDDHVAMKQLLIETYNDDTHEKEMTIEMPVSALDLNSRVVKTHDGVTIKRSDFQIIGKNMEFNTETKQGQLTGHVQMVIFNMSDSMGAQPEAKPRE